MPIRAEFGQLTEAFLDPYAWLRTTAQTGLTGDKSGSFNLTSSGTFTADKFFITPTRLGNVKGGFVYDASGLPIIDIGINVSQFGDEDGAEDGGLFRFDMRANIPFFSVKIQPIAGGEYSPLQISKRTGFPVLIGYSNDNNTGTGNDEPLQVNGDIAESGTKLNLKYLGISAKAADSDKLDNHDTSYFATATHVHTQHFRLTVLSPATAYGVTPRICITPKLSTAITVTNIEVTCDSDPTTEVTGDLKYADTFIGLANATVINDFDTTNGVRSDSSITSASVASGKAIYISFDTTPDAALKSITFDISYTE